MLKSALQTITVLFSLLITSCTLPEVTVTITDNEPLKSMYEKDLEIRELNAKEDTIRLEDYDKIHREKVFELLSQGLVISSGHQGFCNIPTLLPAKGN